MERSFKNYFHESLNSVINMTGFYTVVLDCTSYTMSVSTDVIWFSGRDRYEISFMSRLPLDFSIDCDEWLLFLTCLESLLCFESLWGLFLCFQHFEKQRLRGHSQKNPDPMQAMPKALISGHQNVLKFIKVQQTASSNSVNLPFDTLSTSEADFCTTNHDHFLNLHKIPGCL